MKMVVYLAGKISGKNYSEVEQAFNDAHYRMNREFGNDVKVLDPTVLPYGMSNEMYMPICLSMVQQANVVCMVGDDWSSSKGATIERMYADYQGKLVFDNVDSFIEWMKE